MYYNISFAPSKHIFSEVHILHVLHLDNNNSRKNGQRIRLLQGYNKIQIISTYIYINKTKCLYVLLTDDRLYYIHSLIKYMK